MASHDTLTRRLTLRTEHPATIEYADATGKVIWQLPVAAIVILAEYTTPNGPLLDDYFLVFAYLRDGQWFVNTATFDADGRDEMLEGLSAHWHVPLQFGLCASTDWKSRVILLEELAGHDYFTFTDAPAKSFLGRLQRRFIGKVYDYAPTIAVQQYIDARLHGCGRP